MGFTDRYNKNWDKAKKSKIELAKSEVNTAAISKTVVDSKRNMDQAFPGIRKIVEDKILADVNKQQIYPAAKEVDANFNAEYGKFMKALIEESAEQEKLEKAEESKKQAEETKEEKKAEPVVEPVAETVTEPVVEEAKEEKKAEPVVEEAVETVEAEEPAAVEAETEGEDKEAKPKRTSKKK